MKYLININCALLLVITSFFTVFSSVAYSDESLPINLGTSKRTLDLAETPLEVFLYKPASYDGKRMIIVMHGVKRNADTYRDHAKKMGDRFNALIVTPKFDKKRFPSLKYQRGGILDKDGKATPEGEWTYKFIPLLAAKVRKIEELPKLPFWIIGHSAGGQFVGRMAAFIDTGAERLVAANPGSQLFPTRDLPFGYGFGGLPEKLASDERLKRYLAVPLTIYLGTADNKADRYFDQSKSAVKQGKSRWHRGQSVFKLAQKLAEEKGWACNWRLVEAEGVPHSHEQMFNHHKCGDALFGDINKSSGADTLKEKWVNPAAKWKTNGPPKGTLFISGGGSINATYQRFLDIVGDLDAPIVIIPTAGGDEEDYGEENSAWVRLKNLGATNLTMLHTKDRQVADTAAFSAPLRQAKAVFMSGGSQSRLARAYLHTKTHSALFDVLERGGVVGGSSAGASIQGSKLYGGGKNHLEGFGFIKDSAIGQHYVRRSRVGNLSRYVAEDPKLIGIGIDEATAVIVSGNKLEVFGDSKVVICHSSQVESPPYFLYSEDLYDLAKRKGPGKGTAVVEAEWKEPEPAQEKGHVLLFGGEPSLDKVRRFVGMVGGADKQVVVLSTGGASERHVSEEVVKQLRNLGVVKVTLMHTINRNRANTAEFTEPLRQAHAVWLGGGACWKLQDSFYHTGTHRELLGILKRGGVVAGCGSSATVLGSKICDAGYSWRSGFGLLPNSVIYEEGLGRSSTRKLEEIQDKNKGIKIISLRPDSVWKAHAGNMEPVLISKNEGSLKAQIIAKRPGPLFIVGGGGTPTNVLREAIKMGGGDKARVVVLAQASEAADRGEYSVLQFRRLGVQDVKNVNLDNRELAREQIKQATMIWMPGGGQRRLVEALVEAKVDDLIRSRHQEGVVVSGSSAGAAVMSKIMISGSPEDPGLEAGSTPTLAGLGLVQELIVDQHFTQRRRFARSLSAVLDRPKLVGVGIDEKTAIVVQGDHFEVMGNGNVTVFDARQGQIEDAAEEELQAGKSIQLHVLKAGQKFSFKGEANEPAKKK